MQTSEERGVAGSDPIDSVDTPLRSPASPLPGSRTASRSIDVKGAGTSREAGARHFPRAATPQARAPQTPFPTLHARHAKTVRDIDAGPSRQRAAGRPLQLSVESFPLARSEVN